MDSTDDRKVCGSILLPYEDVRIFFGLQRLLPSVKCDSVDSFDIQNNMGDHLVPLRIEQWNFFERQKSVFSSVCKRVDADFAEFDKELEKIRREMFQLKAPDLGDISSSFLKVDHPIVQDEQGNKRLSLRFDCKQYKPEEIVVKTVDNRLMVEAKHTEESPGRKVYRQFSRQYILPDKINPDTLNSTLTSDGVLSIEGPAPAAAEAVKERVLPITQLL